MDPSLAYYKQCCYNMCRQGQNQFSSLKCHWVYQPYSWAVLMLSSPPIQNGLHIFSVFSLFVCLRFGGFFVLLCFDKDKEYKCGCLDKEEYLGEERLFKVYYMKTKKNWNCIHFFTFIFLKCIHSRLLDNLAILCPNIQATPCNKHFHLSVWMHPFLHKFKKNRYHCDNCGDILLVL